MIRMTRFSAARSTTGGAGGAGGGGNPKKESRPPPRPGQNPGHKTKGDGKEKKNDKGHKDKEKKGDVKKK